MNFFRWILSLNKSAEEKTCAAMDRLTAKLRGHDITPEEQEERDRAYWKRRFPGYNAQTRRWCGEDVTEEQYQKLRQAYDMGRAKYGKLNFPDHAVAPEWFSARRMGKTAKMLADLQRFEGKRAELAMGYGGAVTGRWTNKKEKTMQFKIQHKRVPKSGAMLSTKEGALLDALKGLGVDVSLLRDRAREHIGGYTLVLCTPEQFTKFIITRYSRGGENWIAELDPQLNPEETGNKNARWQEANKVWFVVDVSTGRQVDRGTKHDVRLDADAVNVYAATADDIFNEAVARRPPKTDAMENARAAAVLRDFIRDETLEEVAVEFERRAQRCLTDVEEKFKGSRDMRMVAQRAAAQHTHNSKFVRMLKGGKSAEEVRAAQRMDYVKTKRAHRQFKIAVDGVQVKAYWFPSGKTTDLIKIVGSHTYLHQDDKRINWATAETIPFSRAEG